MAQGNRPGGLTALAVLNFVFFGFACFFILGLVGKIFLQGFVKDGHGNAIPVTSADYADLAIMLVSSTALLVSGIGYLKMRRVMGRMFGNVYAVASLASTGLEMATLPGGVSIGAIIFLIYPLVTLLLVNTTFSDDLTQ